VDPIYNPATDVNFILFTRLNPTVGQTIIHGNVASIQNSNFNAAHPTRFTAHGWGGGPGGMNTMIRNAYHQHGDYNMITIDWSVGAGSANYITSRNAVGPTGAFVGTFIDFLHTNGFVNFATVQVIGHSLGAHVVGHIGKNVNNGRIQVVYGLDAAGPLFSIANPDRLAITDGVYVESMITNGGVLGFMGELGHVNVFPNFGRSQPGCGADVGGGCAHGRTVNYYAESINTIFTSTECQSFAQIEAGTCTQTGRTLRMGGPFGNAGIAGNFIVTTNAASPFSQG